MYAFEKIDCEYIDNLSIYSQSIFSKAYIPYCYDHPLLLYTKIRFWWYPHPPPKAYVLYGRPLIYNHQKECRSRSVIKGSLFFHSTACDLYSNFEERPTFIYPSIPFL